MIDMRVCRADAHTEIGETGTAGRVELSPETRLLALHDGHVGDPVACAIDRQSLTTGRVVGLVAVQPQVEEYEVVRASIALHSGLGGKAVRFKEVLATVGAV